MKKTNEKESNEMNSKILEKIGLDKIDPAIFLIIMVVIILVLLITTIVCLRKLSDMKMRYNKFMSGKEACSLEKEFAKKFREVEVLIKDSKIKTEQIKEIYENLNIAAQKVGIVKYDAFNEMGGKLSFALAMLDKKNNGFIINAMHSREGCYTYVKEVIKGDSYIPLGNEENEALERAMGIIRD